MQIVCGIDEAGYGPTLGPLVVGSATFLLPTHGISDSEKPSVTALSRRLSPLVRWIKSDRVKWPAPRPGSARSTSRARKRRRPILVSDSKRIYSRSRKIGSLEETVLAFHLSGVSPPPRTLGELIGQLQEEWPGSQAPTSLPWYEWPGPEVPIDVDPADLGERTAALAAHLAARGMEVRLGCRVLPEPSFNRLVQDAGSKATVLFNLALDLVERALNTAGAEPNGEVDIRIALDKHGARKFYGDLLAAAFPLSDVRSLKETERESKYVVETDRGRVRLAFLAKGEDRELPIALASMVSKYLREAFMIAFNRHWAMVVPGISPTAGYALDARRFLREIGPQLGSNCPDPELFVRRS